MLRDNGDRAAVTRSDDEALEVLQTCPVRITNFFVIANFRGLYRFFSITTIAVFLSFGFDFQFKPSQIST